MGLLALLDERTVRAHSRRGARLPVQWFLYCVRISSHVPVGWPQPRGPVPRQRRARNWMLSGGHGTAARAPAMSRDDAAVVEPAGRLGPDAGCREPGRGWAAGCRRRWWAPARRGGVSAWRRPDHGRRRRAGRRCSLEPGRRCSLELHATGLLSRLALGRAWPLAARPRTFCSSGRGLATVVCQDVGGSPDLDVYRRHGARHCVC